MKKICVILTVFLLTCLYGCQGGNGAINDPDNAGEGLECGFELREWGDRPDSLYYVACKTEKRIFPIEELTVTCFFGTGDWQFQPSDEVEMAVRVSFVADYRDENGNQSFCFPIRSISDEEFFTEAYYVKIVNERVQYQHSEVLTIPRDLFLANQGRIGILIQEVLTSADGTEQVGSGSSAAFYYCIDGETVSLSNTKL